MKYSQQTVDKICSLIHHDSYTVEEICQQVGIGRTTYFRWQDEKEDFRDAIKKAREELNALIFHEARNSIRRIINGYSYEEVSRTISVDKEGAERLVSEKTVTKHVAPNPTAIIFALKQDGWADRVENTHKDLNIIFSRHDGVDG